MKTRKLTIFLFFIFVISNSQPEINNFISTGMGDVYGHTFNDYWAGGTNPSLLGYPSKFENRYLSVSALELGYSMYSDVYKRGELRDYWLFLKKDTLPLSEKFKMAQNLSSSTLMIWGDLLWLGFSVYIREAKLGLAFHIKDKYKWYSYLDTIPAHIIMLGKYASIFDLKYDSSGNILPPDTANLHPELVAYAKMSAPKLISEIIGESKIDALWHREYGLNIGKRFDLTKELSINIGGALKYLVGQIMIKGEKRGDTLYAYTSITPFIDVNYGAAALTNPSRITQNGGLPKSVGQGLGYDIGLSIKWQELSLSASIIDIGKIKWVGNVYRAKNDTVTSIKSGGSNFKNFLLDIDKVFGSEGVFDWEGLTKIETKLPTTLTLNGYFNISKLTGAGISMYVPMNDAPGALKSSTFSAGGTLNLLEFLNISTGFSFGNKIKPRWHGGVFLSFNRGAWQIGIATRDLLSFFSKNYSHISFVFGFLKFNV